MRNIVTTRTAILLCILVALAQAGCSGTKQYIVATEGYNATLDGLIAARKSGKLDDNGYRKAESARVIAALALDKAKDATAAGDAIGASSALRAFADAMQQLRESGGLPNE